MGLGRRRRIRTLRRKASSLPISATILKSRCIFQYVTRSWGLHILQQSDSPVLGASPGRTDYKGARI